MPEGVDAGGVSAGIYDDPDAAPPPGPDAPKGWVWKRGPKQWAPRERGPVLWQPRVEEPQAGAAESSSSSAAPEGDRDPDPSWMREDTSTSSASTSSDDRVPYDEVPQQVKDDIAGLAGLVGTPILAMLRSIDPYCGSVLAENYEPIVDATLPLICRSSKIVRYFAEDKADWLLWGKLALALKPVGQAILQHHIFRTVEVATDETGRKYARPAGQQGSEHGDHLQPPVQYAA